MPCCNLSKNEIGLPHLCPKLPCMSVCITPRWYNRHLLYNRLSVSTPGTLWSVATWDYFPEVRVLLFVITNCFYNYACLKWSLLKALSLWVWDILTNFCITFRIELMSFDCNEFSFHCKATFLPYDYFCPASMLLFSLQLQQKCMWNYEFQTSQPAAAQHALNFHISFLWQWWADTILLRASMLWLPFDSVWSSIIFGMLMLCHLTKSRDQ